MQRNYFSILFFIRRTRLLKNGEAPIGLRITVNGQRAEPYKDSLHRAIWLVVCSTSIINSMPSMA